MPLLIVAALVIILIGFGVHSLWDRYRGAGDGGIKEWMLQVPGLESICRDYLDLIREMNSGLHDRETMVTHDQILSYLSLDRSARLNVEAFARRYLGWS